MLVKHLEWSFFGSNGESAPFFCMITMISRNGKQNINPHYEVVP